MLLSFDTLRDTRYAIFFLSLICHYCRLVATTLPSVIIG